MLFQSFYAASQEAQRRKCGFWADIQHTWEDHPRRVYVRYVKPRPKSLMRVFSKDAVQSL